MSTKNSTLISIGMLSFLAFLWWEKTNAFSTTLSRKTILIQPLGSFDTSLSISIYKNLCQVYPKVVLRKSRPIPPKAFNKLRNRYRADSLINFLSTYHQRDTVVIGLIHRDISTTKGGVSDWGVMGLAISPGNACVVSTYRLNQKKREEQFYKLAIHELGHTMGLPHCPLSYCFMRNANGGNPLDEENRFCPRCIRVMKLKGWVV